jgi:hypothetical protein
VAKQPALISYPLYLWHWPILSYLSILRNGGPNILEIWIAVAIAVALAWLTFRFIETPIRHRRNDVPQLVLGLAALGVAGIVTAAGSGFEGSQSLRRRTISVCAMRVSCKPWRLNTKRIASNPATNRYCFCGETPPRAPCTPDWKALNKSQLSVWLI